MRFVHQAPAARVVFGSGRRQEVEAELAALGSRPLTIVGSAAAACAPELVEALERIAVATIGKVRGHVPAADVEAAREMTLAVDADCLVAFGGGSAIGLAKAVALETGLPILAVPTTYSGSEMTPVWGITRDGVKTTGRDPAVAPRIVVYDAELTYGLPAEITAASGLNAVAHCIDALWAPGRTPLTDLMAERGVEILAACLPGAVRNGADRGAREGTLAGAWLAGATFAAAGSSLHHKLCHLLGGRYDLPHAETHAVLLPLATALATSRMPEADAVLSRALGAKGSVEGLRELGARLGAPTSLAPYGLTREAALDAAAAVDPESLAVPFAVDRDDVRAILVGAVGPG
jgi:maleylacetate reductase